MGSLVLVRSHGAQRSNQSRLSVAGWGSAVARSIRAARCSAVWRLASSIAGAAEGLGAALAGVNDPERLGRVGDWIIECGTASELLARVRHDGPSGD